MNQNLYVGNIEWNTTREKISELFSQYGNVISVKIIKDYSTGKAKGFAFVRTDNPEESILRINGTELDGRTLKVMIAKKEDRTESA